MVVTVAHRVNSAASCEAKAISSDSAELWVSAECSSPFGATCPPLEDESPPTIFCPDSSTLEISIDFVAGLRQDNLIDAFIQGTRLPDPTEHNQIISASVAGGGIPLMVSTATDRQDFIFQSLADNAIRPPIRSFALLGGQEASGTNVSWTDDTEFPIGTSTVRTA